MHAFEPRPDNRILAGVTDSLVDCSIGVELDHLTGHDMIFRILDPNPVVRAVPLKSSREASLTDIEVWAFTAFIPGAYDSWSLARVAGYIVYKARHASTNERLAIRRVIFKLISFGCGYKEVPENTGLCGSSLLAIS